MDSSIITLLVIGVIVFILLIALLVLSSAIRVVQQYERGVIFVLGRLIGAKGPGIFLLPIDLIAPLMDLMHRNDGAAANEQHDGPVTSLPYHPQG